jgi:hypothetical protein
VSKTRTVVQKNRHRRERERRAAIPHSTEQQKVINERYEDDCDATHVLIVKALRQGVSSAGYFSKRNEKNTHESSGGEYLRYQGRPRHDKG